MSRVLIKLTLGNINEGERDLLRIVSTYGHCILRVPLTDSPEPTYSRERQEINTSQIGPIRTIECSVFGGKMQS
jgi:hypothetical protein